PAPALSVTHASPGKLHPQRIQKSAGETTHLQSRDGLAMRAEQSQLPLEAHGRVIALQFVRRQIKRSAQSVVKLSGRQFRFDRIGVNHRTSPTTPQPQWTLFQERSGVVLFAQGTGTMDGL